MSTHRTGRYILLWAVCAALLPGCAPASATALPPPSGTPAAGPTATAAPETARCIDVHGTSLCLEHAGRMDAYTTAVKLRVVNESNELIGVAGGSFVEDDSEHESYTMLVDEQGRTYPQKDSGTGYLSKVEQVQGVYYQTFYFPPLPADAKKLTLVLPIVTVITGGTNAGFQLDLGDPQPGQTRALDTTTVVAGQTFHFVRAEFEGSAGSLWATIYTEPLDLPDDIIGMAPMFINREKGMFFGAKPGGNGLPYRMFGDLVIPPGKSSGTSEPTRIKGILDLTVQEIHYRFLGPFEIGFELP